MRQYLMFIFLIVRILPALCQSDQSNSDIIKLATIKITYRLSFQPDSLDSRTRREEDSILLIGNGYSAFTTKNKLLEDSAKQAIITMMNLTHGKGISMKGVPHSYYHYIIYKNGQTASISIVDKIGITLYKYNEPRSALNQTITNDKQTILGYNYRKALISYGGRRYEAWFTSEIPISEGPYKFWGLPGLIVQINDTKAYYFFKMVMLSNLKTPMSIPFTKKKVLDVSRGTFRKATANYILNPFAKLNQEGIGPSEAEKAQYQENAKHNNNSIYIR